MRTKLLLGITSTLTLGSLAVAGTFYAMDYFWGNGEERSDASEQKLLEDCQKNGECRKISNWILKKGQCRVYVENSTHPTNNSKRLPYYRYTEYLHGLDEELIADKHNYVDSCGDKKDLLFKFDADESQWIHEVITPEAN